MCRILVKNHSYWYVENGHNYCLGECLVVLRRNSPCGPNLIFNEFLGVIMTGYTECIGTVVNLALSQLPWIGQVFDLGYLHNSETAIIERQLVITNSYVTAIQIVQM